MSDETIGIAGLGFMGRGIAASLLSHGFRILAFTVGADTHERARTYIQAALDEIAENTGLPDSIARSWRERYTEAPSLRDLAPCTFVIESVVEDLAIKRSVYDEIETVIGAEVPVASNTSALPITLLQTGRKHPERFLGMHWAEPAYATRFLELIRGEQTADEAFLKAADLARRLGKDPTLVQKDIPGFIVNRLGYAMYREAVHMLEAGVADAETIDRCYVNAFGLWATLCGPLRWIDITGGPALYAKAMRTVLPSLDNSPEVPALLARFQQEEARGTVNGRGFFGYGPGDRELWEHKLHEHAWAVRELQDRYAPVAEDSEPEIKRKI